MDKMKFTKEDKEKVFEFLNFIATKAEFKNWKTEDTITHFKLLAHLQQVILPKIDANILEVIRVVENEIPEVQEEPKKKTKTRTK